MRRATCDEFAILEFQGHVCGFPVYNASKKSLEFLARTGLGPPLRFVANGALARTAKSAISPNAAVQVQAKPYSRMVEINGERIRSIVWIADRIDFIGSFKFRLSDYEDIKALDDLMPEIDLLGGDPGRRPEEKKEGEGDD